MRILSILALGIGLSAGAAWSATEVNVGVNADVRVPAEGQVNLSFFYESMAPHGSWHQVEKYGWVWQPTVVVEHKGWRPYLDDGRWVYTELGWYWVSNYEWGWAPFHYGRWVQVADLDWVWVPDVTWGASWVVWRETNKVYGWAPLPPGVNFEAVVDVNLAPDVFVFVSANNFLSDNLHQVMMPAAEVRTVFNETHIVKNSYVVENNTVINRGVAVQQVAQATGREIKPVAVTEAKAEAGGAIPKTQMQGDKLVTYRPKVSKEAPRTPDKISKSTNTSTGAKTNQDATKTSVDSREKAKDAKSGTSTTNKHDADKSSTNATKGATDESGSNVNYTPSGRSASDVRSGADAHQNANKSNNADVKSRGADVKSNNADVKSGANANADAAKRDVNNQKADNNANTGRKFNQGKANEAPRANDVGGKAEGMKQDKFEDRSGPAAGRGFEKGKADEAPRSAKSIESDKKFNDAGREMPPASNRNAPDKNLQSGKPDHTGPAAGAGNERGKADEAPRANERSESAKQNSQSSQNVSHPNHENAR